MMSKVKKGDHVKWNWGTGEGKGTVDKVEKQTVTKRAQGKSITRHGKEDNPALVIKQSSGKTVLKLNSEIKKD